MGDLDRQFGHRLAEKGRATRHQLEEDDAERPEVRLRVDVFGERICSGDMYSGEPIERSRLRRSAPKPPAPVEHLRDAEVEHLDRRLPSERRTQKRLRRLEVPVNDAERVRLGEGVAGLQHEVDGLLDRQRAPLLEPRGEVAALQVLHHHVGRAVRACRRRSPARRARS